MPSETLRSALLPSQTPEWVPGFFLRNEVYHYLLPRLRMDGAIPLLPPFALLVWSGTIVSLIGVTRASH